MDWGIVGFHYIFDGSFSAIGYSSETFILLRFDAVTLVSLAIWFYDAVCDSQSFASGYDRDCRASCDDLVDLEGLAGFVGFSYSIRTGSVKGEQSVRRLLGDDTASKDC